MRLNKIIIQVLLIINAHNIFSQISENDTSAESIVVENPLLTDEIVHFLSIHNLTDSNSHHISQRSGSIEIIKLDYIPSEIDIAFYEVGFREMVGNKKYIVFDSLYLPGRIYQKGYLDGRLYYRNKGTFWGAFGVGFLTPYTSFIPGLATGIVMATIPPNERSLRFHDRRMLYYYSGVYTEETIELFNDINYSRGYRKGAHKKKVGSVAGGMGAGFGTGIAVAVVILVAFLGVLH